MQKFFYNPDNRELFLFNNSHAEYYHNKKLELPFDYYIRGLIQNDILYLRAYYPFNDINDLLYNDLMNKSGILLNNNLKDILQALKKESIKINKSILNVSNLDLKRYLNLYYV